jgi:hypothetical protein
VNRNRTMAKKTAKKHLETERTSSLSQPRLL